MGRESSKKLSVAFLTRRPVAVDRDAGEYVGQLPIGEAGCMGEAANAPAFGRGGDHTEAAVYRFNAEAYPFLR